MTNFTLKEIILNMLMFLGVIVTVIWLILKQLGYIQTPWFIEIIPFIAGGFTVLIFFYHVVVFINDLRPLPQQVTHLTKRVDRLEQHVRIKFEHVDADLEFLKKAVIR